MLDREIIRQQLSNTLQTIDLPNLGDKIKGKVRDCYVRKNAQGKKERILITSDRLSAFDRVLTTIPFKGQVLTQMAMHWFEETKDIVANHIITHPHPNVMIGREVKILPIEVVIRGYLTGSAWRDYQAGKDVSGIKLPAGLRMSEKFAEPLITPSTKAEQGDHDEPISSQEIIKRGIVEEKLWNKVCETALKLFARGTEKARERGLILVDTKYEFGVSESGELVLADEVHTQDSSRYWILDSYQARFIKGEVPEMLDKEFVRGWLIKQGYMGEGTPPVFSDDFRIDTALRYIEAYEMITGKKFVPETGDIAKKIEAAVNRIA